MFRAVGLLIAQSLRRQPLRAAMAVLAVAAGVSLAVGVVAARQSASASVLQVHSDISGPATLRVIGPSSHGGLDESVVQRVTGVEGVGAAVPIVQTATIVEDADGAETTVLALGVDCRIEALIGDFGCDEQLESADSPLLPARLAALLEPDGVVRTDLGRIPVATAEATPALDFLNEGRVVVFSLTRAQEVFARPGGLDAVYVVPDGSVSPPELRSAVTDAAGEWNLVGDGDGRFRGSDTFAPVIAGLAVIGVLGLAIGGQLVFNTISLSLEERRRELATISALGGRTRVLAAVVAGEATVLGAVGGLVGSAGGALVAAPLVRDLSDVVSRQAGLHLTTRYSPSMIAVGIGIGVAVALLASIRPARRASRIDLSSELSASAQRSNAVAALRPGWATALLAIGLGGVGLAWIGGHNGSIEWWQPPVGYLGAFLTILTLARSFSAFAPWILHHVGERITTTSGPFKVALSSLVREPGRTAAVAAAVVSAVSMGIILTNFHTGMSHAAGELARTEVEGRLVVSTLPADNVAFVDARPSPDLQEALRQVPGVDAVEPAGYLEVEHRQAGDIGVNGIIGPVPDFDVYVGGDPQAALDRGAVLIGPALSRNLGLRPGDTFDVPGRHGMVELTVGAVWGPPANQGSSLALPQARVDEIWGPQPPTELRVTPAPGVGADELAERIRAADLDPDLVVRTPDELAVEFADIWSDYLAPFWGLQRAMVLMAVVAVVSTLLLVGVQRQREQGVLAAVGMGPGLLARLTLLEAGLLGLTGAVLGTVASVGLQYAMNLISALPTGLQVPFRMEPFSALQFSGVCLAAILVGAALPAWRTSRLNIIEALQYE